MPSPKQTSSEGKTPTLVIDSSAIRNHLFKGWPVLNRIAVIARTGKINLCIPWLIEREVLSGIEKHVDELTEQEAFLKSVRLIAQLSSEGAAIRTLCDQFEALRPKICAEAQSRFQHWLEMSQGERLPLEDGGTKKVFDAYFAGDLPFDKPKNRDHLPDAFIYNAVLALIDEGREIWFVAGDEQLRESLRTKGVRVFRDFYALFADLQVSFDFKEQQALSLASPDTEALCALARASLQSELCGKSLRYAGSEDSAPRIRQVLEVRSLSVDPQSVMHIDAGDLLIAFEADIIARAAERLVNERDLTERLSDFTVSLRGHFLVGTERGTNNGQKIATVEVDDIEVGAMERKIGGEMIQAIPPLPRVASYYQEEFDDIVQDKDSGLVVVVGSTLRNRRVVAEHIIAVALKSHEVALLSFPPIHERQLAAYDCTGTTDLGPLWNKARDAELHALGLSSENVDWGTEAIHYLSEAHCFIVATMKSANNRSAVIRHLANLPNGKDNLESLLAIAWIQEVTAETISFAISRDSGCGEGTWEEVLRRDEWLQRKAES
jgi:hypothetical protein